MRGDTGNRNIVNNLKLEIVSAIPASNEWN